MLLFDLPPVRGNKDDDKKNAKKAGSSGSKRVSGGTTVNVKGDLRLRLQALVLKIKTFHPERLVTDFFSALEYINSIPEGSEVSLDTEGTGLNPIVDKVVGISLHTAGKHPIYIPFAHVDPNDILLPGQMTFEDVLEILALCNVRFNLVYQTAKFDLRMIKNTFGMENYLNVFWDTYIAGNFLNENEPHGLKAMWSKYCSKDGTVADKYEELFSGINFKYVPLNIAAEYGAFDAQMTTELKDFQKPYLDGVSDKCIGQDLVEASDLYMNTEIPLIPIVAAMEDEGVPLDMPYAQSLIVKYGEMLKDTRLRCDATMQELVNYIQSTNPLPAEKLCKLSNPVNIGSPVQMAIIIYDGLGLTSSDKRKPRGTGEEILEKLIPSEPKLQCILDYREISKLMSTYIEKIPNEILEDGKIHTGFNQYGAKTGRFSSSDPVNLQNIPAKNTDIRKMFVADEGCVLVGGDFSQQEPRTLAEVSQDHNLIQSYENDRDIYATIGSLVFGLPYEDCLEFHADGSKYPEGKARRGKMKVLVLAKMYSMGEKSVAESLGISMKEAKNICDQFDNLIPGALQAAMDAQGMAKDIGYVKTMYGRKRRLPDIQLPEYTITRVGSEDVLEEDEYNYYAGMANSKWGPAKRDFLLSLETECGIVAKDNGMKIADAERQALNSIIQGTAADITKRAMVAVGQDERLKKLGYKMLMCVHDELIGKCPVENFREVADIKEQLMINCCSDKIKVAMKVDMEVSKCWTGKSLL